MAILADGQITTSQADIFEVTDTGVLGLGSASINKITFFNTNAAEQTAILFVKKLSGTARKLRQFKLQENEGGEYLEPGETLRIDHGDTLQAITTTAGAVDFVVFGALV